jgi:hypothetical protein
MFRLAFTSLAALASLAACGPVTAAVSSDRPVMAEDLLIEGVDEKRSFVWEFSPQIARYPAALQLLRDEAQKQLAGCNWDCLDHATWTISHDGSRLLQLKRTGITGILRQKTNAASETIIVDKQSNGRLAFTDLFASWAEARPVLQARWCQRLTEWRRMNGHVVVGRCPPIEEMQEVYLAFLTEGVEPRETRVNSIVVDIHYAETSYGAAGEIGGVTIPIDNELLPLFAPSLQGEVVAY